VESSLASAWANSTGLGSRLIVVLSGCGDIAGDCYVPTLVVFGYGTRPGRNEPEGA
jgi:hypothetical protein